MLDMGFLPDIRRVLKHLPPSRADAVLLGHHAAADRRAVAARCCANPAPLNIERKSAPATGDHAGGLSGARRTSSPRCCWSCCGAARSRTCSSSPAPSTAPTASPSSWSSHGVSCDRIHGNRSQAQRTEALAGFKSGRYRVLVATDIAARGIDVEALSHVVNFDVPQHARGLHPPRRPHRPRRADRRRLHLRLAGGEGRAARRSSARSASGCRGVTLEGFDYEAQAGGALRDPDRRAHRRDPRPQGRGARPRPGQGGAQGAERGRPAAGAEERLARQSPAGAADGPRSAAGDAAGRDEPVAERRAWRWSRRCPDRRARRRPAAVRAAGRRRTAGLAPVSDASHSRSPGAER